MRFRSSFSALLTFACFATFGFRSQASTADEENLPEAVTKLLAERYSGATIRKTKKKTKDRAEIFEFKLADELNKEKEFTVVATAEGKILKEEEHQIQASQVPSLVQDRYRKWKGAQQGTAHWSAQCGDKKDREYQVTLWIDLNDRDGKLIPNARHYSASFQEDGTFLRGSEIPEAEKASADAGANSSAQSAPPTSPSTTPPVAQPKSAEPLKEQELDPDVVKKVRKLIRMTLNLDEGEREKAWKEIREMGNLAVPGLVAVYHLAETTPEMVRSILIALGDSKDPRAGPALVEVLGNKDPGVRRDAARAIGDSNYKPGVEALKKLLSNKEESDEVRLFAASSAAKLGSAAGLETLKTLLKSERPEFRARAVFALGKFGGAARLTEVTSVLHDSDRGVREDAVEALRLIGGKPAWGPLVDATKDEDYKVRGAAMDALRELTHKNIGNEPKEWQEWWAKESGPKGKEPEKKKDAPKDEVERNAP